MAIKFVSPENLETFKGYQDTQNDEEFAKKNEVPANVSALNNDAGYQTAANVQQIVSEAVSQAVASVTRWKGVKATTADLPSTGNQLGDIWHVNADGSEWAWNGTEWEELGTTLTVTWDGITGKPQTFPPSSHTHTMSQVTDMPTWAKQPTKPAYTYSEVGAASSNHSHTAFKGATASVAGVSGFVPAPPSGGDGKVLMGNGSWGDLPVAEAMQAMTEEEIQAIFQ